MRGPFYSTFQSGLSGSLEVITGPMFSGKTEELIRRIRRAEIARVKIQIFKPSLDNRYDEMRVVSHSSQSVNAVPVNNSLEILTKIYDSTRIVAIDEVQFFDDEIITIINKLTRRGHRVIVAGLDLDYRGRPFGPMPTLLAMADDVMKIQAICTVCGGWASKTQRIVKASEQILVGESSSYEARCRGHHEDHGSEEGLLPHKIEVEIQPGVAYGQRFSTSNSELPT